MKMSNPFQAISRSTIPDNAPRIIELEVEVTLDMIKVTPIVASGLDNVGEVRRSISVRHKEFNAWLESEGRLEAVSNTSDHTGAHVQSVHELSYTDYIKSPTDVFIDDLYDFLFKTGRLSLPYVPE